MAACSHSRISLISPALEEGSTVPWRTGSRGLQDYEIGASILVLCYGTGFGFWVNTSSSTSNCQDPPASLGGAHLGEQSVCFRRRAGLWKIGCWEHHSTLSPPRKNPGPEPSGKSPMVEPVSAPRIPDSPERPSHRPSPSSAQPVSCCAGDFLCLTHPEGQQDSAMPLSARSNSVGRLCLAGYGL